MANQTISTPLLIGKTQDQGGRSNMEDRAEARPVHTSHGLFLTVAMIADGIGGNNCGEVAAQIAIDTTFQEIQAATMENPNQLPHLLAYALKKANEAVFTEATNDKEKEGMGTTATVAAVHEGRLYLANVGDSRAYLIRDGRAQQLTIDHTWAREMVRLGHLKPEEAAVHPKGEALVRSIGYSERLEIDLGIYVNGDEDENSAKARQGFPLQTNDRLVLCSDGLIKERHKGSGHYVEPEEMASIVLHNRPEKAAQMLVKKAVSRKADDNVSAIVLEMPGSKRAFSLPPGLLYGVIGLVLIAVLAGLGSVIFSGQSPSETAVPIAAVATATAVPTPTDVPLLEVETSRAELLLIPGPEGAEWFLDDNTAQAGKDQTAVTFTRDNVLTVVNGRTAVADRPNVTNLILPARVLLFLDGDSEATLKAVEGVDDSAETRVRLSQGRLLAALPEGYNHRLVIENPLSDEAWIESQGLMVVRYQEDPFLFMVACLETERSCQVLYDGKPTELQTGEAICFGAGCPIVGAILPVAYEEFVGLAPGLVPAPTAVPETATVTAEPSATKPATRSGPRPTAGSPTASPTRTVIATNTPGAQPPGPTPPPGATQPPTNTPRPGTTPTNIPATSVPTATPPQPATSAPTNTPLPPPTNTPLPPPTNTPLPPPTNTPLPPPTNTPLPPPTSTPGSGGIEPTSTP